MKPYHPMRTRDYVYSAVLALAVGEPTIVLLGTCIPKPTVLIIAEILGGVLYLAARALVQRIRLRGSAVTAVRR